VGRIVAFHLPADDVERAAAFYAKIFGWELTRDDDAPTPYDTDPARGTTGIAGALIERAGALKDPIPVLEVDDADATMAKLERLGGLADLRARGAYRYAQDSEGNGIALAQRNGARTRPGMTGPGAFVNFHLPADDVERATAFYGELFGWELRALSGTVPYVVTNPAQPDGPGIEAAIIRREMVVKAPTPTIEVQWIDDAMALVSMNQGQQASVQDIPGIGRFGYARDCEGNTIALLQRNLLLRS
jgi:uncharacterized protein